MDNSDQKQTQNEYIYVSSHHLHNQLKRITFMV